MPRDKVVINYINKPRELDLEDLLQLADQVRSCLKQDLSIRTAIVDHPALGPTFVLCTPNSMTEAEIQEELWAHVAAATVMDVKALADSTAPMDLKLLQKMKALLAEVPDPVPE